MEIDGSPNSVDNKVFVVEIADPAIATYIPDKNGDTGTLKLLKPGETTIKVYAKYNPSACKEIEIEVTETGGHDYVIKVDEDGDGKTTATCSKCGKVKNVTVPNKMYFPIVNGYSGTTAETQSYEVGTTL